MFRRCVSGNGDDVHCGTGVAEAREGASRALQLHRCPNGAAAPSLRPPCPSPPCAPAPPAAPQPRPAAQPAQPAAAACSRPATEQHGEQQQEQDVTSLVKPALDPASLVPAMSGSRYPSGPASPSVVRVNNWQLICKSQRRHVPCPCLHCSCCDGPPPPPPPCPSPPCPLPPPGSAAPRQPAQGWTG